MKGTEPEMIIDNLARPPKEAFERLSNLSAAEKAGTLAILFEQWDYGLVNEENSENPSRVLDHGKDVLSPSDVGVIRAASISVIPVYRGLVERGFYASFKGERGTASKIL